MAISLGSAVLFLNADPTELNKKLGAVQRQTNRKFGNILRTGEKVGKGFTVMGAGIVTGLGLAVKTAADFEQAITDAASITGRTGQEFEQTRAKMAELAQTLGQTTVFSASEAAAAFIDLSQKGFDVAAMTVAQLEPILNLATALRTDLPTASALATGTLQGFGFELDEMGRVADVFSKSANASALNVEKLGVAMPIVTSLAKASNVTFEETVATLGKLADRNIDASTSATGLRNIFAELLNPGSALEKQLKAVGLTAEDVSLKNQTFAEVLAKLQAAGFDSAAAMEAFGKRSGPIATVLLEISGEVETLTAALEESGGTAKGVAERQLQTLGGQLKLLGSAFESVVIPIGEALIPALTALASAVAPVLQRIAEWAKANPGLTQAMVGLTAAVGAFMAVVGPMLLVLPGLVAVWPAIAAAVGVMFGPLGAVAAVIVATVGLIVANWDKVKAATLALVDFFKAAFSGLKGFFVAVWDGIVAVVRGAVAIIKNIVIGIINAIKEVIGAVASLPGNVADFLGFAGGGVVPGFASGGVVGALASGGVTEHRIVQVGERGPELAALPAGTRVMSNADMENAVGGGPVSASVEFSGPVTIQSPMDAQQVGRIAARELKRMLDTARGDRGLRPETA